MALALAALALTLLAAACLAARLLPHAGRADRLAAVVTLAPALTLAPVYALGLVGALAPLALRSSTVALCALSILVVGRAARSLVLGDLRAARDLARAVLRDPVALAAVVVGLASIALALLAAYILPTWSWDALGYHLPIALEALQRGDLRAGPVEAPYLHTYPRAVDLGYLAWRAWLTDPRWVDAAQLPWGFALWAALATLARRAGASPLRAISFTALSLAMPVVALQLPSAYIDVAVAALTALSVCAVTGPLSRASLLLAALSLGLLLGAKPSTPPLVAALSLALLVRARRASLTAPALLALALAFAIGGERYLSTALSHGNPLWPVRLKLGPVTLPGQTDARYFFNLGFPPWFRALSWPAKVAVSWFSLRVRFVFDMRVGGFGPLFVLVLAPLTALFLARRDTRPAMLRAWPAIFVAAAPAAFWTRYVIAVPCLLLASVIAAGERLSPRWSRAIDVAMVLCAAVGLWHCAPGYTDGGPPLLSLVTATDDARRRAVSVDGHPDDWARVMREVGEGDATAHDLSFGLPGQLRDDRLGARVLRVPATVDSPDKLVAWARRERVRVLALGGANREAARARPSVFTERFRCPVDDCAVFTTRR